MNTRNLSLLLLIIVISRLPFLWLGYGEDPDTWRVARSASTFWTSGLYEPSRLPGYPLHEIISGPFVTTGGAPLSNAITLLVSLLLVLIWKRIAERESRNSFLLILALSFSPFIWKSSVSTIDYLWSLTAILFAFNDVLKGRPVTGGIWTGIAAGFRPVNALVMIPFLILLRSEKTGSRPLFLYCIASAATTAISLLPLFSRYGLSGWFVESVSQTAAIDFSFVERLLLFGYRSVTFIGIPAAIVSLVFILRNVRPIAGILRRGGGDRVVVASTAGLVTFLALYLAFPLEREYLLPALPFALLLLDRIAPRGWVGAIVACHLSLSLMNPDVIHHQGARGIPGFNIHRGVVLEDWSKRNAIGEFRKRVGSADLRGRMIVMTGENERLWFENDGLSVDTSQFWSGLDGVAAHQKRNPDVYVVPVLDLTDLARVRNQGFTVYYDRAKREYLELIAGYRMEEQRVVPLELW